MSGTPGGRRPHSRLGGEGREGGGGRGGGGGEGGGRRGEGKRGRRENVYTSKLATAIYSLP